MNGNVYGNQLVVPVKNANSVTYSMPKYIKNSVSGYSQNKRLNMRKGRRGVSINKSMGKKKYMTEGDIGKREQLGSFNNKSRKLSQRDHNGRLLIFGPSNKCSEQLDPTNDSSKGNQYLNTPSLEHEISFIPNIFQRLKTLEQENKQLKYYLDKNREETRQLKNKVNNQNWNIPFGYNQDQNDKALLAQLNKIQSEKQELLYKYNKLQTTYNEEKFVKGMKNNTNIREIIKEHENKLLFDIMTNTNNFNDNFLKEKIKSFHSENEKMKLENESLKKKLFFYENNYKELDTLRNRILMLENENRIISEKYEQINNIMKGNETYEDLKLYRSRISYLETELKGLREKYNNLKSQRKNNLNFL